MDHMDIDQRTLAESPAENATQRCLSGFLDGVPVCAQGGGQFRERSDKIGCERTERRVVGIEQAGSGDPGGTANLAMAIVYAGVVLHFLYGVGFLRLQIIAKRTHMDAADVRQGTLLLAGSASAITLGVVVASMFGYLPIWAAVPLLPQMTRAYLWLGGEQAWLNLRRMGRQEVVLAVSLMAIFALVAHA